MSGRVLIVEDDTRIASWVKVYFERAGFSAEVTHDGETGLELARDLAPDLVVLDLTLPKLDGVELCRILRRESEVPIIMLTAREAHADRITGLDSGADDYIVKPFDPGEVIARAGAVLRRVKGKVQQVLTRGSITLNETTQSVTVEGEPVVLGKERVPEGLDPGDHIAGRVVTISGDPWLAGGHLSFSSEAAPQILKTFDKLFKESEKIDPGPSGQEKEAEGVESDERAVRDSMLSSPGPAAMLSWF